MAIICWSGIIGSPAYAGPSAHRSFSVTDFDVIRVEAPVEVLLTSGRGVSIAATGDRVDLDALDIATNGGVLTIRMRSNAWRATDGARQPTRISMTARDIRRADVSGVGSLAIDRLKGGLTSANVSGSGALKIGAVVTDRINVNLMGAGTIAVSGTVPDAQFLLSGAGKLDAEKLMATRVRLMTDGAVDARLSAKSLASVDASGASHIVVSGTAKCTIKRNGSASISCGGANY